MANQVSALKDDRLWSSRLVLTTAVACIASAQFGYHMSELNGPGLVLSCQAEVGLPGRSYEDTWFFKHGIQSCIEMNDKGLGLVTSIFPIGGLFGSLYGGTLCDSLGRKFTSVFNALIYITGSVIMVYANTTESLAFGRFIAGLGAGCTIVVTPLMINEISTDGLKGVLGSMTQVSINLGILGTQILAINWSNSLQWRFLLVVGALIGVINFILLLFIDESPKWLHSKGYVQKSNEVLLKLRNGDISSVENEIRSWDQDPNDDQGVRTRSSPGSSTISLYEYIKDPKYRSTLLAVTALTSGPQFCGINSIVFYGVKTISKILPAYAVTINCLISLLNVIITSVAAPLIDRLGRKPCLQSSSLVMGISSALMSIGILNNFSALSILTTFTYVGSFAIGLGPIPFLMISELSQVEAKGAAQSYGTTISWISTFLIGYLFPILDKTIGGYVYLIFAFVCASFFWLIKLYIPETKGHKSFEEVWGMRTD